MVRVADMLVAYFSCSAVFQSANLSNSRFKLCSVRPTILFNIFLRCLDVSLRDAETACTLREVSPYVARAAQTFASNTELGSLHICRVIALQLSLPSRRRSHAKRNSSTVDCDGWSNWPLACRRSSSARNRGTSRMSVSSSIRTSI